MSMFSNGLALAMAIAIHSPNHSKNRTSQNSDVFVKISNIFGQNGSHLSGFQLVGLLDFRSHSKSGPLATNLYVTIEIPN